VILKLQSFCWWRPRLATRKPPTLGYVCDQISVSSWADPQADARRRQSENITQCVAMIPCQLHIIAHSRLTQARCDYVHTVRTNLGCLYMTRNQDGDQPKALLYLSQSVEGNRRVLGEDHTDTVAAMLQLSQLYAAMGEEYRQEAEVLVHDALTISRARSPTNGMELASALLQTGSLHSDAGDFETAEPFLVDAVSMIGSLPENEKSPTDLQNATEKLDQLGRRKKLAQGEMESFDVRSKWSRFCATSGAQVLYIHSETGASSLLEPADRVSDSRVWQVCFSRVERRDLPSNSCLVSGRVRVIRGNVCACRTA
jgi:hypothetical protein